MKTNKPKLQPEAKPAPEMLSLDEFVSNRGKKEILYARINGGEEIAAVELKRKPVLTDKVLCRQNGEMFFQEISKLSKTCTLRLVARNGEPVECEAVEPLFEVLGVVTHILKTLVPTN